MNTHHLAQLNIARMIAPLHDPVMDGFRNNLDRINELAERSEGFAWRLKDYGNDATSIRVYDDDFMIVNMSVWSNLDSLFSFVYKSAHLEIFKRKNEWFEKMKAQHMVLWYVPEQYEPSVEEAIERLEHIRKHGETPSAFTFKKAFTPSGEPYKLKHQHQT